MEPDGSSLHSQVPATCAYPEPDQPSSCPHITLPKAPPYSYPPIYACVFQTVTDLLLSQINSDLCISTCDKEDALLITLFYAGKLLTCSRGRLPGTTTTLTEVFCAFAQSLQEHSDLLP